MNLILLGPPGAGKGTQAARIAAARGWAHFSSGDILRAEIRDRTQLGIQAQTFMNSGALVPDPLILEMMAVHMDRPEAARGFVLDGFPRTVAQAEGLDERLDKAGRRIGRVIHLVVADAELESRLSGRRSCPKCNAVFHVKFSPPKQPGTCDKCGAGLVQRPDDKLDVVQARIRTYHDQTRPLVDYYETRNLLTNVDGGKGMDEVSAAIDRICEKGA